jgi:hypothetical protein
VLYQHEPADSTAERSDDAEIVRGVERATAMRQFHGKLVRPSDALVDRSPSITVAM